MLGRGGRDGNQAAFVILLWVGQAGQYSYLMHQQVCMNYVVVVVVYCLRLLSTLLI